MEEVSDLLRPQVLSWFISQLQQYRLSGENARIEFYVQNGYIVTYWGAPINKVDGKKKRTT